ncbi:MAG: HesA/MoeB/ThiF family protein [Rhodobacteraceae bacterium]|nr:HesA/MoeB/ThiF family protein [Paracoccaceae bacterium]
MIPVLALAGAIWGIGALMGVPARARWPMLGLLYVAVLGLQVALPAGHPLREATGGSAAPWLILGGAAGLVLVYARWIRALRARVPPPAPAAAAAGSGGRPALGEAELERYARHIMLREIGGAGQRRLAAARVLVIGAGGLGSPALMYLAAAGVGTIGVIDDDVVEASNLQRQVIHAEARIGMPKVFSAELAMKALNPHVAVRPYRRRLTAEIAGELFADYDLVIDGSDSLATRRVANAACVARGLPLLSAAIAQWEGQVSLFHPAAGGPCYACVFPEDPAPGLVPTCAEAGVAGPLPGVIGAMLALEAVKWIAGAGTPLAGRMLIHDALHGETRTIALKRRPGCPVCGG